MIQMLIVGYWYGLRSERKLAQEVELHLAYHWFCRLNRDNKVSHHSTFSENRPHRFRKSDVLRHMQRDTLETIMEAKIPEGLAERRHLVNQLLDAVSHEKGLRVVKIINLYFDQEAQRMLSNLLKDVASVPDDFIIFCQDLLSPKPHE
jgi:Transposase domain (DUF772)